MNHGNNKKPVNNSFDQWVDRVNKKLSRFLGKRDNNKLPRNRTSTALFSCVLLISLLIIWGVTGFYYLRDDQYGVVIRMGHLNYVAKGLKVGITLPYPFEQIVVFDGGTNNTVKIGDVNADDAKFVILSKELEPIIVSARFSYQITNPESLYANYLQEDNDVGEMIAWHLKAEIHQYISEKTVTDIKNSNLIVIANELRNLVNSTIENYGVKITKLNIEALHQVDDGSVISESKALTLDDSIANELIKEAKLSYQTQIDEAKTNVETIRQLIPAYEQNPDGVATELYYETLKEIPVVKTNNYPLLELNLAQLLTQSTLSESLEQSGDKINNFRQVRRERNFERSR